MKPFLLSIACFPILFSLLIEPSMDYLKSEETKWVEILKIEKEVDNISTDRLGNLYLIKENRIWMYNNQGDSIALFNSRKYGNVSYMDTSDPYQILVFFQDYGIILFLDNYLSENGDPINLQDLGFDRVSIACLSQESGFWVFDQLRQKAFHLNNNFQITHETVNLSQWFNKTIEAKNLLEYNNQLFLSDENWLYVFDHFGTFQAKHSINHNDQLQFLENRVLYLDSTRFCQYHLRKFQTNCDSIPFEGVKHARMERNRLYISGDKTVRVFEIK